MIRKIIHIDEDKCNGCGLCATACHEGAIDIINGKAKLVRENSGLNTPGRPICTQFSGHWIKIESLRIHHGCFSEFNAVVVTVALSGHGLNDSVFLKFTTVECVLVLPTLIRVHDQTLYRGKADSARFPEPAFPRFSGSTSDEAYPFPRPAPPVCQAHDKKYILQKQKSQTTNFDLIVWGFCFCVALVPLFLLKMPVTVWHFHITNSHQGFSIIIDSVY